MRPSMGQTIMTNNKDCWLLCSNQYDLVEEFASEKDLKSYLAVYHIYSGKLNAIKALMSFPGGFVINDVAYLEDFKEKKVQEYCTWHRNLVMKATNREDYYKGIDDKLNELISL